MIGAISLVLHASIRCAESERSISLKPSRVTFFEIEAPYRRSSVKIMAFNMIAVVLIASTVLAASLPINEAQVLCSADLTSSALLQGCSSRLSMICTASSHKPQPVGLSLHLPSRDS